MKRLLIVSITAVLLVGCYLPHQARLGESIVTHRLLVKRPFEEIGLVHAEVWGPTIYWQVSSADLRKAVRVVLIKEAKKRGADAVIDVDVRIENHYSLLIPVPVPFIAGYEECHATGTAIRFTD